MLMVLLTRLRTQFLARKLASLLHGRSWQRVRWDAVIPSLIKEELEELRWWHEELKTHNGRPVATPTPDLITASDASDTGGGLIIAKDSPMYVDLPFDARWHFRKEERAWHITMKETSVPLPGIKALRTLTGHSDWLVSVAFDPTHSNQLASGSADNTIKLWDTTTGECLRTLEGHSNDVKSVAYDPTNNNQLASGSYHTIKLWDITTGECLRTLEGHSSYVLSVAFDPTNSNQLASGYYDNTIKLWDITTGECLRTLTGHT
eukprot:SAG11_NODE_9_length_28972_cov_81.532539_11_plen_262_part_00